MKAFASFAMLLLFLGAGNALPQDARNFTGVYRRAPLGGDSCGRTIFLTRVRHNRYHIDWELAGGEHFVMELEGKPMESLLDFRKGMYGYTYRLSEHGTTLTVTLKTPNEERICTFFRAGSLGQSR